MNIHTSHSQPHLSTRLLLSIYQEGIDDEYSSSTTARGRLIDAIRSKEEETELSFTISRFLPDHGGVKDHASSVRSDEIKDVYRNFLTEVVGSCSADKDATKTMYNIISSNSHSGNKDQAKADLDQAYKNACSLFGYFNKTTFTRIVQLVHTLRDAEQSLRKARDQAESTADYTKEEYGAEYEFLAPILSYHKETSGLGGSSIRSYSTEPSPEEKDDRPTCPTYSMNDRHDRPLTPTMNPNAPPPTIPINNNNPHLAWLLNACEFHLATTESDGSASTFTR